MLLWLLRSTLLQQRSVLTLRLRRLSRGRWVLCAYEAKESLFSLFPQEDRGGKPPSAREKEEVKVDARNREVEKVVVILRDEFLDFVETAKKSDSKRGKSKDIVQERKKEERER
jgi:hypothetical protein